MLYTLLVISYILACLRVARGTKEARAVMLERGASVDAYRLMQWCLWLFILPPLASIVPLPLSVFAAFPLPITLILFVPSLYAASLVLRAVPAGGYDYQERATDQVKEVLWVGAGGFAIVEGGALLSWYLGHAFTSVGA